MQDLWQPRAKRPGAICAAVCVGAKQLAEAEQTMAQGVLELACELARQVLRREFVGQPDVVMPVLLRHWSCWAPTARPRWCAQSDGLSAAGEQIAAILRAVADPAADAALQQGGCVVESAGTVVDGSLHKRWRKRSPAWGWPRLGDTLMSQAEPALPGRLLCRMRKGGCRPATRWRCAAP
jgi:hypothetical protein